MRLPRNASGWTMAVFGVLAVVMGVVGLVAPDALLAALGFTRLSDRAPGDYTRTFLAASSMASLNMGVYYLVAVATDGDRSTCSPSRSGFSRSPCSRSWCWPRWRRRASWASRSGKAWARSPQVSRCGSNGAARFRYLLTRDRHPTGHTSAAGGAWSDGLVRLRPWWVRDRLPGDPAVGRSRGRRQGRKPHPGHRTRPAPVPARGARRRPDVVATRTSWTSSTPASPPTGTRT